MVTTGSYNPSGTALHLGITDAADMDITSAYYTINQQMKMNLANSYTRLTASNALYISTYSIIDGNTANIFSIPNASSNNYTIGDNILVDATAIFDISVGGNYDSDLSTPTQYFRNSIGELIIYNRALEPGEYTNTLGYLQSKWGFPLATNGAPNNISDLLFWYDANDLDSNSGTWVSKGSGTYGPNLTHYYEPGSSTTSVTIYNSNQYANFNSDSENLFIADSFPYSYTFSSSYTFFAVTADVHTSGYAYSGLMSINPTDSDVVDDSYPGLALYTVGATKRITIVNGFNPSRSDGRCLSTIEDPSTPINFIAGPQITCINHKNISNMGFNKIYSKGSLSEISDDAYYEESGISPDVYVRITIGAIYNSNLLQSSTQPFIGLFGEFIYYNRSLNDTETQSVFKYLEGKWLNGGGTSNPCY